MTPLIADIVVFAFILLLTILGARKGLLESLLGVAILIASFVGASWMAKTLSPTVALWMRPMVQDKIDALIPAESSVNLNDLLDSFGYTGKSLENLTDSIMDSVQSTGSSLVSSAVDGIVSSIAYATVYVVGFLLLALVLWLFTRPLKLAEKLPGLRTLNLVGGGLLGLLKGVIFAWVLVWAAQRLQLVSSDVIENSYVIQFFVSGGPLALISKI